MPDDKPPHYGSAERVVKDNGLRPADLRFETTAELTAAIEEWLVEIKDIIDRHRGRDFTAEAEADPPVPIPPLVHNVANRMAGNMVQIRILRGNSPVVSSGDFNVQMVQDKILTKSIRQDLKLIPRGPLGEPPFRIWRIRSKREMTEAED